MTPEQILELAKSCGFDDFTGEVENFWECWEDQLIEFAHQIRRNSLHEMISRLSNTPNAEVNQPAINLIESQL